VAGLDLNVLLLQFAVLILSLTVHEAAHAWSADKLGDPTARLLGRLSLNPVVHIDPIGTLLLPLISMTTGAPLLGWAKPVPVNTHNLQRPRQDFMLIAAAGPISNLIMAVIAAVLLRALVSDEPTMVVRVLSLALRLNVILAVFNLIPIPPLDGGNVLAGLLPGSLAAAFDRLRPFGFILLYVLMLTGVLSAIIVPPVIFITRLLLS
jgi:Zn-dependent protease